MRLGIIGSGAVTEILHLPAASAVLEVVITHVADLSTIRAQQVAARFNIPNWTTDWREMIGNVDAVLVATPPHTHVGISIRAMEAGLDVLCEKPLAASVSDIDRLIAVATKTGRHLAVGLARHWFWNAGVVKRFLEEGMFGDITEVHIEEGGKYSWPARTSSIFEEETGVGVLLANGVHNLDLLTWWFGENIGIKLYEDDAWHGPEANCRAELELPYDGKMVTGLVEFSTTRLVENKILIRGTRLTVEINPLYDGDKMVLSAGTQQALFGNQPVLARPENDESVSSLVRSQAEQLRRFATSCKTDVATDVTAQEARKSLVLIERCYAQRRLLQSPWLPYSGTSLGMKTIERGGS